MTGAPAAERPPTETPRVAAPIGRYRWTIRRGHLPPGLRLDARTGLLAGIPGRAGTFHFLVKVNDRSHPRNGAIQSLTLIVKPGT